MHRVLLEFSTLLYKIVKQEEARRKGKFKRYNSENAPQHLHSTAFATVPDYVSPQYVARNSLPADQVIQEKQNNPTMDNEQDSQQNQPIQLPIQQDVQQQAQPTHQQIENQHIIAPQKTPQFIDLTDDDPPTVPDNVQVQTQVPQQPTSNPETVCSLGQAMASTTIQQQQVTVTPAAILQYEPVQPINFNNAVSSYPAPNIPQANDPLHIPTSIGISHRPHPIVPDPFSVSPAVTSFQQSVPAVPVTAYRHNYIHNSIPLSAMVSNATPLPAQASIQQNAAIVWSSPYNSPPKVGTQQQPDMAGQFHAHQMGQVSPMQQPQFWQPSQVIQNSQVPQPPNQISQNFQGSRQRIETPPQAPASYLTHAPFHPYRILQQGHVPGHQPRVLYNDQAIQLASHSTPQQALRIPANADMEYECTFTDGKRHLDNIRDFSTGPEGLLYRDIIDTAKTLAKGVTKVEILHNGEYRPVNNQEEWDTAVRAVYDDIMLHTVMIRCTCVEA